MNSFATANDTKKYLEAQHYFSYPQHQVHLFDQTISLRLTQTGDIFRDVHGEPSFYAPGHGDLLYCLSEVPAWQNFTAHGGKYAFVCNVDNVAATPAPFIIGAHIALNKSITVEIIDRHPGDHGGAPVFQEGRLHLLEEFRFPENLSIQDAPVFNSNNFVLNTDILSKKYPLQWFRAEKKIDRNTIIQFERLLGEITSFVPSAFLHVPRTGELNRFIPVKTPDDMPLAQAYCSQYAV